MGKIIFWLVLVFAVLLVLRLINTSQGRASPVHSVTCSPSGVKSCMRQFSRSAT